LGKCSVSGRSIPWQLNSKSICGNEEYLAQEWRPEEAIKIQIYKRSQAGPYSAPGYSVITEIPDHLQLEEEEVDHFLSSFRRVPRCHTTFPNPNYHGNGRISAVFHNNSTFQISIRGNKDIMGNIATLEAEHEKETTVVDSPKRVESMQIKEFGDRRTPEIEGVVSFEKNPEIRQDEEIHANIFKFTEPAEELVPALGEEVHPQLGESDLDGEHLVENEQDGVFEEAIDYSYILSTWNSAGVPNPGRIKPISEFGGDEPEAIINTKDNPVTLSEMNRIRLHDGPNGGIIIQIQDIESTMSIDDIEMLRKEMYQSYLEKTGGNRKNAARLWGINFDRIIQYFQPQSSQR